MDLRVAPCYARCQPPLDYKGGAAQINLPTAFDSKRSVGCVYSNGSPRFLADWVQRAPEPQRSLIWGQRPWTEVNVRARDSAPIAVSGRPQSAAYVE